MSLLKLPVLLSGLITARTLQTPPTPRVPAAQREKDIGWLEWYISNSAHFNCELTKVSRAVPHPKCCPIPLSIGLRMYQ